MTVTINQDTYGHSDSFQASEKHSVYSIFVQLTLGMRVFIFRICRAIVYPFLEILKTVCTNCKDIGNNHILEYWKKLHATAYQRCL